jgi:hypothetical protein
VSDRFNADRFVATSPDSGAAESNAPEFVPPKYGQAAAIYALYQASLIAPQNEEAPPPRRPGGGKLAAWFDSFRPLFRTPAFSRA